VSREAIQSSAKKITWEIEVSITIIQYIGQQLVKVSNLHSIALAFDLVYIHVTYSLYINAGSLFQTRNTRLNPCPAYPFPKLNAISLISAQKVYTMT